MPLPRSKLLGIYLTGKITRYCLRSPYHATYLQYIWAELLVEWLTAPFDIYFFVTFKVS